MQSTAVSYDCVVIGAGIEGSATAYQLIKRGKRTLLIDMFPFGSSRGSSQGTSRIIRRAYADRYYAQMMDEAYAAWADLEKESGEELYRKLGLLVLSDRPYDVLDRFESTMSECGFTHEMLDHASLKSRFPSLRLGVDYRALYDPGAGVLRADCCLNTFQKRYVALGGHTMEARVTNVKPGDKVVLETSNGIVEASSVIVCAGPWATCLLPKLGLDLPLHAKQVGVYYWPENEEGSHSAECFPCLIDVSSTIEIYSTPTLEFPGQIKICCNYGVEFDPTLNKPFDFEVPLGVLRPYVRKHFPKVDITPSQMSHCFYTETPDKAFVLDRHPKHANIIIGSGFSGTGFKLAPVVGKILASLATNDAVNYDLTPFRIDRFESQAK